MRPAQWGGAGWQAVYVSARRVSPVLVGREAEAGVLLGALEVAAGGLPQVVLVGAEAGGGKSRLVGEVTARVRDRALVLAGGCVVLGAAGLPYAPITAALRELVRERGVDGTTGLLPGGDAGELAALVPELGSLSSAGEASVVVVAVVVIRTRVRTAASRWSRAALSVPVMVSPGCPAVSLPGISIAASAAGTNISAGIVLAPGCAWLRMASRSALAAAVAPGPVKPRPPRAAMSAVISCPSRSPRLIRPGGCAGAVRVGAASRDGRPPAVAPDGASPLAASSARRLAACSGWVSAGREARRSTPMSGGAGAPGSRLGVMILAGW